MLPERPCCAPSLPPSSHTCITKTTAATRMLVPENEDAVDKKQSTGERSKVIVLLTDGLPTMGAKQPWIKRVSSKKRRQLFTDAVALLPAGVPVNIILFPMEGDPLAADAFWRLAKKSNGSFFSPARDWP